jgi:endonuclease III-like uncharacterized protein
LLPTLILEGEKGININMSVQEIEQAIEKQFGSAIHDLDRSQIEELREWFENFLEDQLEMTDEFKASIDRASRSLSEKKGRIHKQGGTY